MKRSFSQPLFLTLRRIGRATALCAVAAATLCAQSSAEAAKLLDNAYQAMVATHYAEAGSSFEAAAEKLSGNLQFDALYKAGLAWTLIGDSASLHRGANLLASLLVKAEPEDPTFHKSMLLRAWNSALLGDSASARQQLTDAEIYLPPNEIPRALWICQELMTTLGDRFAADSCEKKLQKNYPNSLEARYSNSGNNGRTSPFAATTATAVPTKTDAPRATPSSSVSHQAAANNAVSRPTATTTAATIARPTPPSTHTSDPSLISGGKWCIQFGAFGEKENAEALAAQYRHLPGELKVVPTLINRKTLYLVRLFSFESRETAEAYRKRVLDNLDIDAQIRLLN